MATPSGSPGQLNKEEIKNLMRETRNKERAMEIAEKILAHPENIRNLWELVREEGAHYSFYAAWILDFIGETQPQVLEPFIQEVCDYLLTQPPASITRSMVRLLSFQEVPEDLHGPLYDLSVKWISSPMQGIATRAHCMEIAFQIAMPYPELRQELAAVIQAQLPGASAGIRSRGQKILKQIQQLNAQT